MIETLQLRRFGYLLIVIMIIGCSSDDGGQPTIEPENPVPETPATLPVIGINANDANPLTFARRIPGRMSERTITVNNTGSAVLEISAISLPEGFTSDWSSGTIAVGGSREMLLQFSPAEVMLYEGVLTINSNAENNENTLSIEGEGVNMVYEGSINLGNQNQVDAFGEIGYTEITESLCIGGNCNEDFTPAITDLSPLLGLTAVETLFIRLNPDLESLQGLNNIGVGSYFLISSNRSLKNLDAVSDMPFSVLPLGLTISSNPSLENLDGLHKINAVGDLRISTHESLQNINGLSTLIQVVNGLEISYNPLLTELDALSKLETVGEDVRIEYNDALYGFCGIKLLLEAGGYSLNKIYTSYNRYNPSLEDIVNGQCEFAVPEGTYYGDLRLSSINYLVEKSITKIIGDVIFNDLGFSTGSDPSFVGLKLTEITGSLSIINNNEVLNLDGLETLTSVGGYLDISRNAQLSNFCGLVPLLQANGLQGGYTATDNAFNPTQQELLVGTCSQ